VSPDFPLPDSSVEVVESVRIRGEVIYVSSGDDTDEDEPSTPRAPATHLKLYPTSALKPSNYPPPEVVLTGPIIPIALRKETSSRWSFSPKLGNPRCVTCPNIFKTTRTRAIYSNARNYSSRTG
jgi:hypothetical protein